MMNLRQESLLEWLEARGHPTGEQIFLRKKYGGLEALQTRVVRGEVMIRHLVDMTKLPRFKGHKWTIEARYRALIDLRDIGMIHLEHDGFHYRVRTQRALSGGWGPPSELFR